MHLKAVEGAAANQAFKDLFVDELPVESFAQLDQARVGAVVLALSHDSVGGARAHVLRAREPITHPARLRCETGPAGVDVRGKDFQPHVADFADEDRDLIEVPDFA